MPADTLFHEAGISCYARGERLMAFVFLNRSLDVSEMIEEHPFLPYVAHPFSPYLRN